MTVSGWRQIFVADLTARTDEDGDVSEPVLPPDVQREADEAWETRNSENNLGPEESPTWMQEPVKRALRDLRLTGTLASVTSTSYTYGVLYTDFVLEIPGAPPL